ncbi:9179_t:CDS:2 [Cetraspora pellucida]|uniref:9179_t:CDS:1 n=1 Tax=Cetraspora pellucida TaxID=1433469 RepID=A0A9N8WF52_9GLOM|nr:9179_t:CDS:2 [Cetraspora pellucida]
MPILCVPCSVCSKLMNPEKSLWIFKESNTTYSLTTAYPDIMLVTNPNPPPNRIAICSLCKSNPSRNYPPYLSQVPLEIELVPLEKRRYLSSVFLHCSLGRTPRANPFTEYRSLVGTMNYSQNLHSLSLYSSILGAFLKTSTIVSTLPWLNNSLINAVTWLKEHNLYLYEYTNLLQTNSSTQPPLPTATHLSGDDNIPPIQPVRQSNADSTHRLPTAIEIIERSTYSDGLAWYITKYISKSEPTHLFNIQEQLCYREYIHARRMGSMELMFLLLGERITNSLTQVQFLTTDPPSTQSKAILPLYMIDPNDDNPYWSDKVEKYFACSSDPIFDMITKLHRQAQQQDTNEQVWNVLSQKLLETIQSPQLDTNLNTTHIVGYHETAELINRTICTSIPIHEDKVLISDCVDIIDNQIYPTNSRHREFANKTNLPSTIRIQPGARVMFLNNSQYRHRIANGTVGIVTDLNLQIGLVYVSFCVEGAIINTSFTKYTHNFYLNGLPASRTQYPIQNAFALTVHKTQGLTIPDVSLNLDNQIFEYGQAYVALSRCTKWEHVKIQSLDRDAFIVDRSMTDEYERLESKAHEPLPLNR